MANQRVEDGRLVRSQGIEQRILRLVRAERDGDNKDVTPKARLKDDLRFDSLDLVELSMRVDEEFGIEMDSELLDKVETVKDLVTVVQLTKRGSYA